MALSEQTVGSVSVIQDLQSTANSVSVAIGIDYTTQLAQIVSTLQTISTSLQTISSGISTMSALGSGSGIHWVRPFEWQNGTVSYEATSANVSTITTVTNINGAS